MPLASRVLVLALFGLAAAEDCADGTCRADEEEMAMLQKSKLQSVQSHRHASNKTDKKVYTFCEPSSHVSCPDSTNQCAGNQCCPPTAASDYKTFPCPSADKPEEAGCGTSTKVEDCLAPAPAPPAGNGECCGSSGSTLNDYPDCEEGLVCTPPQNTLLGGCSTCQVPAGHQVGQECGNSPDGQYYGACMDGLVCAPPADAAMGTTNVCASICGEFDGNEETINGGCNRMQSCSCKAATPCYTWKEGAEGCYMYCC
jgi:hypothetical protein